MDVWVNQGREANRPARGMGLVGIAWRYAALALFVAGTGFSPAAHAQDVSPSSGRRPSARALAVPVAAPSGAAASVDVSGLWQGNLQAPGDSSAAAWTEGFEFTQDAAGNVTGTRDTTPQSNASNSYRWSVTGNVSGNTLTLNDVTLVAQGNTSNTACKTSMSLTLSETPEGTRLQGTWTSTQSGCFGGTLDITRLGGQAAKNLGSGATCDGGVGSPKTAGVGGGSGGTASGNADGSSCAEAKGAPRVGDPIDASTGNFYLQEDDYEGGPWLTFRRFYNSNGATVPAAMGFRWRHVFDRSLSISGATANTIISLRPDGKQATYTRSDSVSAWTTGTPTDILTDIHDTQGAVTGYTLFVGGTRQTETYDLKGHLISVLGQDGQGITLAYTTTASPAIGLLSTVTDSNGRQLTFVYDSSARVSVVKLPDGKQLSYGYGFSSSNLGTVVYADDRTRNYAYNESGYVGTTSLPNALTGITDERSIRYESITYDNLGRATSSKFTGNVGTTQIAYQADGSSAITYPLGNTVHLAPVSIAGLTRVGTLDAPCTPDCGQPWKSRTYDANGFPASMVDFNGVSTQTTYDVFGLLHSTREAVGLPEERLTQTTWDATLRLPLVTRVLDSSGTAIASTSQVYGATGLLLARCDADLAAPGASAYVCSPTGTAPAGIRRRTYTYCAAVDTTQCPIVGLMLSSSGPRNDLVQTTTYKYYMDDTTQWRHGDLKSATDALGHVTTIASYDGAGRPMRTIDANGVITDLTYTSRGWLQSRTVRANADGSNSSDDALTTIAYTAVGNVDTLTEPSAITTFVYDDAHRLTDIRDVAGNRIHYVLDAVGNRVQEQVLDPSGAVVTGVTRTYSVLGRLATLADGLNRVVVDASVSGSYDGNGNLIQSLDGLGVQSKATYDGLNRLIGAIQDGSGKSTATHNAQTVTQYDALDRIEGISDPEGLATTYARNAFGDVLNQVSPDTGHSSAGFDAAGNATASTDARGTVVNYTYDALNRRTSATYPTAADNVSWHYDEPDSVTACAGSFPIGRLTRIVESAGTTTYCYDKRGNLTRKRQAFGTQVDTTNYTYTRGDLLDTMIYPNGGMLTYSRDYRGRITSILFTAPGVGQTVVREVTYLPFGPLVSYRLANDQTVMRTYDANYAVADVTSPALNLHFARDVMGNLVSLGAVSGATPATESYSYDPLYRLTSVNDASGAAIEAYTYNKTGDRLTKAAPGKATGPYGYQVGTHWLTSIGTDSRTYDANGNTTGSTMAGDALGFGYNGRNRMTVVQRNGATVGTYVYNALGERVSKTVTTPTASTTRFVYDQNSQLLAEYGAANRDIIWLGNVPIATVDGAGSTSTFGYIHADALGAPRAVADANGATIWTWGFQGNPFGEALQTSVGGYSLGLRFPGQYFDVESGLSYNFNRDYDAATGRYIQSDPLAFEGGQSSLYAYANSNPINGTDESGLACNSIGCWNTQAERGYANAGNYSLYYQSACAGGDPYACRAGEVAANYAPEGILKPVITDMTNTNLRTSISSNRPPMDCDQIGPYINEKMEAVRKGLALARANTLDGATPTHPISLPRQVFSGFHHQVFQQNGASGSAFGGDKWDKIHGDFFTNYDWCPSPACWAE